MGLGGVQGVGPFELVGVGAYGKVFDCESHGVGMW